MDVVSELLEETSDCLGPQDSFFTVAAHMAIILL